MSSEDCWGSWPELKLCEEIVILVQSKESLGHKADLADFSHITPKGDNLTQYQPQRNPNWPQKLLNF